MFFLAVGMIELMLVGCSEKNVRPNIIIVTAEREYNTAKTLPSFAKNVLEQQYGFRTTILAADANNPNVIPGFADGVAKADVLLLSVRRRALPTDDINALHKYLDGGKPLVAIRTSCHAFDIRGNAPNGHADWATFDPEVLGGNYHGHYGTGPRTSVTLAAHAEGHPILTGIETPFTSNGSLYKTSPLGSSTEPLLIGRIPNQEPEPVAWTNKYKNARVFYTSLGHPDDFDNPQFCRLLINAIFWAMDKPVLKQKATK